MDTRDASPQDVLKILEHFGKKPVSVDQALSIIKPGDRIFAGTACATPRLLMHALENKSHEVHDVQLFSFLTSGAVPQMSEHEHTGLHHVIFFVGSDHHEVLKAGNVHYAPVSLALIPELIKKGTLSLDAAFIQVSPPDNQGYVSLGVSVDTTMAAAVYADKVIAEVNPNMPYTYGESRIPLQKIDACVMIDAPVIEYVHSLNDTISDRIARYISSIIEDHSTLQIGLGRVPNEMLKYLKKSRNLGIHSDLITDPVVDLIEDGIITGKAKTLHRGKVVASFCMGTERLYRMVDRNPLFSFHPIDYVCDPSVIMANNKLVSVTQAWSIDLSGQVCVDQYKGQFYSGVSTQLEFHRYASKTPGGKSIICLCSTDETTNESRIRANLLEGEGVAIPRSEVHYVITEYGYAYLFGKTLHDRALSLIEIAHPMHRDWLLEEAKRMGYVSPEMSMKTRVAYPEDKEVTVYLKSGQEVVVRPSRASDVMAIQDLFYSLAPEDVFTRFFHKLSCMPVSNAQYMCDVDYENEMAFVAVLGGREHGTVIGTAGYVVDPMDNLAEAAYMVRSDFQGQGLGSVLQKSLVEYARRQGLRGLKANILESNTSMINLLHKLANVEVTQEYDPTFPPSVEVKALF